MDGETVDTVTGWESEPLSGGIDGLRGLQSREFTGAVTEGRAWLFMLNGRIVGIFDGSLESFEDADGTAYAAPDPSLPLLYAMRETGGETKARYYTNDTALSAADAKLSSGKFTGYVELSENVLSGDYYVVYYGGRRLACAFVGTGKQKNVLTDDEAFSAADDEVGIYEVVDVDIDVVDLPDPESDSDPEPTAAAGASAVSTDDDEAVADGVDGEADADDVTADAAAHEPDGVTFGANDDTARDAAGDTRTDADSSGVGAADPDPTPSASGDDPTPAEETVARESTPTDDSQSSDPLADGATATSVEDPGSSAVDAAGPTPDDADASDGADADSSGDPFSAEEQWRETKSIPSLDPSETEIPGESAPGGATTTQRRTRRAAARETNETAAGQTADSSAATDPGDESGTPAPSAESTGESAAAIREELATVRQERDRARDAAREAREQLDASESDLARLREENGRLTERVEELESQISDLREELESARANASVGASGDNDAAARQSLSADRALTGTNLFVRYDTKGGATLSKAHAGGATRSDVNDNLRLEVHTDFEADDVAVDGSPFREFLTDTIEYGFVEWAVRELLYEIQSTGNESALRDLFDAIPEVDRAELNGTVVLESEEGGSSEHAFDVVLRDRMGNPLLVADVTEGRDATTESMLDGLVGDAGAVADADEHLAGAFYVTASFFEPGALEAAADATGGGLLSRGKRKSFVRLSRKQGFHLCLVESREGEFHVNVPEL